MIFAGFIFGLLRFFLALVAPVNKIDEPSRLQPIESF